MSSSFISTQQMKKSSPMIARVFRYLSWQPTSEVLIGRKSTLFLQSWLQWRCPLTFFHSVRRLKWRLLRMDALEARNSANDTLYASDLRKIGKCASNSTRLHGLHIFCSGGYSNSLSTGLAGLCHNVMDASGNSCRRRCTAPQHLLCTVPVLSSTMTRGSAYRVTSKVHGSVSKETVGDERLVFLEGFGIYATFRSGDAVCSVLPMTLGLSPRVTVCVRGFRPIIERYGIST